MKRRQTWSHRHIAGGLLPAVTIAPKAAVPLAPSPRSQDLQTDTPRSAISAAILMSSLTGQAHSLPSSSHVRIRSHSLSSMGEGMEMDVHALCRTGSLSSVVSRISKNEDGCNVTWAEHEEVEIITFAEDQHKAPNDATLYSESDEETGEEEETKGLHKRRVKRCHELGIPLGVAHEGQKERTIHKGMPHDDRDQSLESESSDLTDVSPCEASSLAISPPPNSNRPPAGELRASNALQQFTTISSIHHPSPMATLKSQLIEPEEPMTQSRKDLQGMKYKVASSPDHRELPDHQSSLPARKPDSLKRKERRSRTTSLVDSRTHLQAQESEVEDGKWPLADGQQLKQEWANQDLLEENRTLKLMVHRLSLELGHYRAQHGLNEAQNFHQEMFTSDETFPQWLADTRRLCPLVAAYEEGMLEKDEIVHNYGEQLSALRSKLQDLEKENQALHTQIIKLETAGGESKLIREQSLLVLDENELLVQRNDFQKNQLYELQTAHVKEVSHLREQLSHLEEDKRWLTMRLIETQSTPMPSKDEQRACGTATNHTNDMLVVLCAELQRSLSVEREKHEREVLEMRSQLHTWEGEQLNGNKTAVKVSGCSSSSRLVEKELEFAEESNRRLRRRLAQARRDAEEARGEATLASQHLGILVAVSERTMMEKEYFLAMARALEMEKEDILKLVFRGNVKLGKLHEKVQSYRTRTAAALSELSSRAAEAEQGLAGHKGQFVHEVQQLRGLLGEKQGLVEALHGEKRRVEAELEVVWRAAMRQTKQLGPPTWPSTEPPGTVICPVLDDTPALRDSSSTNGCL
uniref:centrosomal protein of 89 kDa-like n=1 Tax=Myxine glutinosa TaxID=7769 RepID=UPI00358E27B7